MNTKRDLGVSILNPGTGPALCVPPIAGLVGGDIFTEVDVKRSQRPISYTHLNQQAEGPTPWSCYCETKPNQLCAPPNAWDSRQNCQVTCRPRLADIARPDKTNEMPRPASFKSGTRFRAIMRSGQLRGYIERFIQKALAKKAIRAYLVYYGTRRAGELRFSSSPEATGVHFRISGRLIYKITTQNVTSLYFL